MDQDKQVGGVGGWGRVVGVLGFGGEGVCVSRWVCLCVCVFGCVRCVCVFWCVLGVCVCVNWCVFFGVC